MASHQSNASRARLANLKHELLAAADPKKARHLKRFFKTGKGEYGENDCFLGITVPAQRRIASAHLTLDLRDVLILLHSRIHEYRFTALLMLVSRFNRGTPAERTRIHRAYLSNTKWINNWDLVDLTAPTLVGAHLMDKSRAILNRLAASKNLWERRIAIVSTYAFIRKGDFTDALRIAGQLLDDRHDLIHKATGWMLREIGKRDRSVLDAFLKDEIHRISRTTLRYAIERHPERERIRYLRLPIRRHESP